MITVVARPDDDNDIVEVYMVESTNKIDLTERYELTHDSVRDTFNKDWDDTLEKVKKKNPETWCLDEVIKALVKKGWQIIRCETLNVAY